MRKLGMGKLLSAAALATLIVAAPAAAQEPPEEESGPGVSCEPANPAPGSTTTCTATGLAASSAFEWAAQFTDNSTAEGNGTADANGAGTFTVDIPDTPIGGYQVTVTGTAAEGGDYSQSHQGAIAPGGEGGEPAPPEGAPEDPAAPDAPEEEPAPGDDGGDTQPAPDAASTQPAPTGVSNVPSGGVATGAGGTADPGNAIPLVGLTALLLAVAGHVAFRREHAKVALDK